MIRIILIYVISLTFLLNQTAWALPKKDLENIKNFINENKLGQSGIPFDKFYEKSKKFYPLEVKKDIDDFLKNNPQQQKTKISVSIVKNEVGEEEVQLQFNLLKSPETEKENKKSNSKLNAKGSSGAKGSGSAALAVGRNLGMQSSTLRIINKGTLFAKLMVPINGVDYTIPLYNKDMEKGVDGLYEIVDSILNQSATALKYKKEYWKKKHEMLATKGIFAKRSDSQASVQNGSLEKNKIEVPNLLSYEDIEKLNVEEKKLYFRQLHLLLGTLEKHQNLKQNTYSENSTKKKKTSSLLIKPLLYQEAFLQEGLAQILQVAHAAPPAAEAASKGKSETGAGADGVKCIAAGYLTEYKNKSCGKDAPNIPIDKENNCVKCNRQFYSESAACVRFTGSGKDKRIPVNATENECNRDDVVDLFPNTINRIEFNQRKDELRGFMVQSENECNAIVDNEAERKKRLDDQVDTCRALKERFEAIRALTCETLESKKKDTNDPDSPKRFEKLVCKDPAPAAAVVPPAPAPNPQTECAATKPENQVNCDQVSHCARKVGINCPRAGADGGSETHGQCMCEPGYSPRVDNNGQIIACDPDTTSTTSGYNDKISTGSNRTGSGSSGNWGFLDTLLKWAKALFIPVLTGVGLYFLINNMSKSSTTGSTLPVPATPVPPPTPVNNPPVPTDPGRPPPPAPGAP